MTIHSLPWQAMPPAECRRGVVSIGNFDGVHRGHAALMAELRRQADTAASPAIALTFDPHPLTLLRPAQALLPLSITADRAEWLEQLGADHVLVLQTTADLLVLDAATFFEEVIHQRLAARALVEGVNFGFGRDRGGDVQTLAQLCGPAGMALTVVPPVLIEGQPVSSSRIRALLLAGDVGMAAQLLGRPHRLHGTVGSGAGRGRGLGFPTANLQELRTLAPGDGVYAARAHHGSGSWPAAVNVGPNPTFGERGRKIEAHLLGFSGELKGQPLALDFVRRLRDTRPFASAADLVEQLHRDIEQARQAV